MERERLSTLPLKIHIVGNPYNRKATEEATELLEKNTRPITSRGLNIVDDSDSADLYIIMDAPPKDLARYARLRQVVLVTAQNRSKQSLETYLKECQQRSGSYWNNVRVVNINPKDNVPLIKKWWGLNLAVFSISED